MSFYSNYSKFEFKLLVFFSRNSQFYENSRFIIINDFIFLGEKVKITKIINEKTIHNHDKNHEKIIEKWKMPVFFSFSADPGNFPHRQLLHVLLHPEHNFDRVVCPNFGHPARTSSFTKYKFLKKKNSEWTVSFEIVYLLFSQHAYSIYNVRKPSMTKLGQGVQVREHYPNVLVYV